MVVAVLWLFGGKFSRWSGGVVGGGGGGRAVEAVCSLCAPPQPASLHTKLASIHFPPLLFPLFLFSSFSASFLPLLSRLLFIFSRPGIL